MRQAACALLALLVLLPALPVAEAGAPMKSLREADRFVDHRVHDVERLARAGAHVVRDTLRDVDELGAGAIRAADDTMGGLVAPPPSPAMTVLGSFLQPVVLGHDDMVAGLWVRPDDASAAWDGLYWVESEAGIVPPQRLVVGDESAFLTLYAGPLALAPNATVTYHFHALDGTETTVRVGPAPVYGATPYASTVAASGATASQHGETDLQEVVLLTPWNLFDHPVRMGFTLLDESGGVIHDVLVGGCADPAAPTSEAGCRPLYLIPQADLDVIELWWEPAEGGERTVTQTLDVLALRDAPQLHRG